MPDYQSLNDNEDKNVNQTTFNELARRMKEMVVADDKDNNA